ncbi:MAG: GtrA family protein, partial [Pseudomonadota bacterium]
MNATHDPTAGDPTQTDGRAPPAWRRTALALVGAGRAWLPARLAARLPESGPLLDEMLRIVRYVTVGLMSTITHVGAFLGLIAFAGIEPALANPLGILCAIPVSYLGHYYVTFASAAGHRGAFLRFVLIVLVSFAISQTVVTVFQSMDWAPTLAAALFVVLVPVANFLLFRYLVFAAGEPAGRG